MTDRIAALQLLEPHPQQAAYLRSWRYRNHFIGGRGAGKTSALVAKAAIYGLTVNPGATLYLTEETGPQVRDILLAAWRAIVPDDLYTLRVVSSAGYDAELVSGSVVRMRSRQARNTVADPPFRGPSAQWIGHDECGLDREPTSPTRDVWLISEGMLRGGPNPSAPLCLDGTSTPRIGAYYSHLRGLGLTVSGEREQVRRAELANGAEAWAAAYYCTTSENAYNQDLDARLRGAYSAEFARQELDAEWVSLEGRVWREWSDAAWPAGNRHPAAFDRSKPWELWCDIGLHSAWLVVQRHPGPVEVVVGEYTPDGDGDAVHVAARLAAEYGTPFRITVGSDVNTRSEADGIAAMAVFQRAFGRSIVQSPRDYLADKRIQLIAAQAAILDTAGRRRLAVSRSLRSWPGNGRGILELMDRDSWPEKAASSSNPFDKEGRLEHVRDALLYGAVMAWPPPLGDWRAAR